MQVIRQFILLLVMLNLLSACAVMEEFNEGEKKFSPEDFIVEKQKKVEHKASLGPKLNYPKPKQPKRQTRKRINKEDRESYIDVAAEDKNLFKVNLHFENVKIRDAMFMLSEVTGKNVLVGDEVEGVISARLIDVPWNKALDSILKTKGLAKHIDHTANIIRIHKQNVLLEQESYDRKRIEDMQKAMAAKRAVAPLYTELFRLHYTDTKTIKAEIEGVLGADALDITMDERINSLIIKGTEKELDLVARLIDEIDVRTKQILIEAFIVEANDDFAKELGSRLGYDNTSVFDNSLQIDDFSTGVAGVAGSQASTAGALTLGDAVGTVSNLPAAVTYGGIGVLLKSSAASLKVELTAMESEGKTNILSNPHIFTLNNEEAVVIQGREIGYSGTAEGGGTTTEFKEVGIQLKVTPSIVGDGNVILSVEVEKSSADLTITPPPITKQELATKLLVKDKSVAVIGGVFTKESTDAEKKVPFFGDIPGVGRLFRYDKDSEVRKELLIFLAPRVI